MQAANGFGEARKLALHSRRDGDRGASLIVKRQRMKEKGKAPKMIPIAIGRRLPVILNPMIKNRTTIAIWGTPLPLFPVNFA
jgi:hypothetical protein